MEHSKEQTTPYVIDPDQVRWDRFALGADAVKRTLPASGEHLVGDPRDIRAKVSPDHFAQPTHIPYGEYPPVEIHDPQP